MRNQGRDKLVIEVLNKGETQFVLLIWGEGTDNLFVDWVSPEVSSQLEVVQMFKYTF